MAYKQLFISRSNKTSFYYNFYSLLPYDEQEVSLMNFQDKYNFESKLLHFRCIIIRSKIYGWLDRVKDCFYLLASR